MIQIKPYSKIYIFCLGNYASGGPEALHQLAYYLRELGYDAYVCYFQGEPITPERYIKYKPVVLPMDEVCDHPDNVIVMPENSTYLLNQYALLQKCIWWLSLNYYRGTEVLDRSVKGQLKDFLRNQTPFWFRKAFSTLKHSLFKSSEAWYYVIGKNDINLCGSQFAFEYVSKRFRNVRLFVEPLGLDFLRQPAPEIESMRRSDVVLYNPAKPSRVMDQLLKRKDILFRPLQGLNEADLIDVLRKSKLYIEFGLLGGPERLPKESVYNGMLLLVGERNAAKNNFDIAIPQQFKLPEDSEIESIAAQIKSMLINYDLLISKFQPFAKKIDRLEENFIKAIEETFKRCSPA